MKMKLARIAFVFFFSLALGMSIAALRHVPKNRLSLNETCRIYRTWMHWQESRKDGSYGPIDSWEYKCGDALLARLNRSTEWRLP